jgi:hypothetical protein
MGDKGQIIAFRNRAQFQKEFGRVVHRDPDMARRLGNFIPQKGIVLG